MNSVFRQLQQSLAQVFLKEIFLFTQILNGSTTVSHWIDTTGVIFEIFTYICFLHVLHCFLPIQLSIVIPRKPPVPPRNNQLILLLRSKYDTHWQNPALPQEMQNCSDF